jgi:hypothetical protein
VQGPARRACAHCHLRIIGKSKYFFTCQIGDDLPRIRHRRDCQYVIFVVLLVIASDGGSCGDVGRKFFVMTSNVGMTPKLIPQVLLSELMLELKEVYGNINNGYNLATII